MLFGTAPRKKKRDHNVQFLSCEFVGVYFTLPLGESSLSEERALAIKRQSTNPRRLPEAQTSRKTGTSCVGVMKLKTQEDIAPPLA